MTQLLAGGGAAVLGGAVDEESKSSKLAPFDVAAGKDGDVRGEGPPR